MSASTFPWDSCRSLLNHHRKGFDEMLYFATCGFLSVLNCSLAYRDPKCAPPWKPAWHEILLGLHSMCLHSLPKLQGSRKLRQISCASLQRNAIGEAADARWVADCQSAVVVKQQSGHALDTSSARHAQGLF